jgi:hypothetical protein
MSRQAVAGRQKSVVRRTTAGDEIEMRFSQK